MMAPPVSESPADRFEACFRRNYADVARFCARRAASAHDAEDAATEVFATAWRRLGDVPDEPGDRLWLFGVARRVLANQARGARRRTQLVARLQAAAVPAPEPSTGSEAARVLARALAALSDGDRELLLLTGWEELTPAQIAVVLGRPAPLVSRRLHRARGRLAAQLANASGDAVAAPTPSIS